MDLSNKTPGSDLRKINIEPSPSGPMGPAHAFEVAGMFVALLYAIHIVGWIVGWVINVRQFGILPRTISGLFGIFAAPLLHANMGHLLANTIPMFILMSVLFSRSAYKPFSAFVGIWILGGLGTWLFARGYAVHIGASGLVYGIAAYIIAAGFTMQDILSIVTGIVIAVMYSGLIFGMMPWVFSSTSWEGHLFGAVAGVLMAFMLHGKSVSV
ncbi:MAG: rhomboid family intramembrane serine protease [Candidatus Methylacidiphilales bacterium]|nr:rhomboid family intramembrane serine protease [Candidatus Methylacidiphilales bacterium]